MGESRVITVNGNMVYSLFRLKCPYYLHQELHVPEDQKPRKIASADAQLLARRGDEHEERLVAETPGVRDPGKGTMVERAARTLELMRDGVPAIHGGVLAHTDGLLKTLRPAWAQYGQIPAAIRFEGIPDLLVRVPGESSFGDYRYEVGDIKTTKGPKPYQQMQVVFYSWLLEPIQGVLPDRGFITPLNGRPEHFDIAALLPQWLEFVEEELIEAILEADDAFYHLTSACQICRWHDQCRERALAERDLSLIAGLTRPQKKALLRAGIRTYDEAAKMDAASVVGWKAREAGLSRIKRQARALSTGKIEVKQVAGIGKARFLCVFDMESDPLSETEYLFGMTVFEGNEKPATTQIMAISDVDEAEAFRRFLAWMDEKILSRLQAGNDASDIQILHYGSYEPSRLRRLVGKHGDPADVVARLQPLMVDVLSLVRNTVVLPLEGYGLKEVAPLAGFKWRWNDASAANSFVWYNEYVTSGDPEWLERIRAYNEDDLLATMKVFDWLLDLAAAA